MDQWRLLIYSCTLEAATSNQSSKLHRLLLTILLCLQAQPMDFGTIAGRVNAHAYPTYEGFVTDVGLMRYFWEQVSCHALWPCLP